MAPVQFGKETEAEQVRSNTPVHGHSRVPSQITLGHYLFQRLLNSGSKSIFGVPGDFNLPLLEYLYDEDLVEQGLNWIGTCNELNGAYAADGYSRYTNKIGCVITTFGVGELSAINGVAGAFAEDVKVLHIVGVSPTKFRENELYMGHNVHHLVPGKNSQLPPNHKVYHDMVKDKISCSTAYLEDINTACDEIDRVIADIFKHSKPGYIFIPADFSDMMVSDKNLLNRTLIDLSSVVEDNSPPEIVASAGEQLLQWIYASKTPSLFADLGAERFGLANYLRQLINRTDMWNFSSLMAKSTLDEKNSNYLGVYKGNETGKELQVLIESSDLVLHFGPAPNEINTGYYSFHFGNHSKMVELQKDYIKFIESNGETRVVENAHFVSVLKYVLDNIEVEKLGFNYPVKNRSSTLQNVEFDQHITQSSLKPIVQQYYNAGDVLIAETGSFQFGVLNFKFESEMKYISQNFYLSIGMALPATLGVGCGMRDYPRSHIVDQSNVPTDYVPRLILCEGDGAAQMTIQEFASYIRYKIPMEILLWNNNGYTVERAIKGPTRSYNDIAPFKWTALLNAFGDFENKFHETKTVSKNGELINLLQEWKTCNKRSNIKLVEVMLPVMDIPEELNGMLTNGKV